TRYCYLGERRLSAMERELPADAFVIGVDEHTAALFDLAARTVTVVGNGRLTVRRHGDSAVYPSGSLLDLDDLASGTGGGRAPVAVAVPAAGVAADSDDGTSLLAAAERASAAFDAAFERRDVDGCVTAVLDLEQALADWSADTLTSDEGDRARAALRRMVVRLGELAAVGARDPAETLGPFVDALLDLRRRARDGRDYAVSDWIRDRLAAAGVEVRDTADGSVWNLR